MKLINKAMMAVAVVVGAMTICAPVAAAASSELPPVNVDTTNVSTITIAAPIVTILVSLAIPLINGFLTTWRTRPGVKVVITIVLNAAWSLIANGIVADGSSTFSSGTLYTALIGTIISIASYAGVYKPLNITSNEGGSLSKVGRT